MAGYTISLRRTTKSKANYKRDKFGNIIKLK